MTTPYQTAPDGAFVIGGGGWNYGQTMNEDIGRAAFEFPMPTIDNMLYLLQLALERLPIEALQPFAGFLGLTEGLFDSVGSAVTSIIESLTDRPIFMVLSEYLNLVELFEWLWEIFSGLASGDLIDTIFKPIVEFLKWVFEAFGDSVETMLKPLIDLAAWFWGLFTTALGDPGDLIEGIFKPIIEFAKWLFELFDDAIEAILKPVFELAKWVWELFTSVFGDPGDLIDAILKPALEFAKWVWELFTSVFGDPGDLIDTLMKPMLEFGKWLIEAFSGTIDTVLKPAFDFLNWLLGTLFSGAVASLQNIFTAFEGLLNPAGFLTDWLAGLPSLLPVIIDQLWSLLNGGAEAVGKTINDVLTSVGDFMGNLFPALTGIPGSLAIGDITTWARGLLNQELTWPDFKTLFGEIPEAILGVLPLANISLVNPELMSQGGFDTSTTLDPTDGWAWHTDTFSGTGGSARVTGNATARSLYSNQSISVAGGDQLLTSCRTKSTGTVGAAAITLSVVPFTGLVPGAATTLVSRGASAAWVLMNGGTYTVPAGVTSLRMVVGVTALAAAGSYVWFDNISVKKTGLLDGNWMTGILGTVAQDIQAGVDNIVSAIQVATTTGNPLTSIKSVLETIFTTLFGPGISYLPTSLVSNPLLPTAIPGISATKITSDQLGTGRIPNLPGSIITSGTIQPERLNVTAIGQTINPGPGSGAQLIRTTNGAVNAGANGFNLTPAGFFNLLDVSSADIQCLRTNGEVGTGAQSDYAGAFRATMAGWYMVELAVKVNANASWGWRIAPVLYKGTTLANATHYKIGTDVMYAFWGLGGIGARYVQNTWIVYMNVNDVVRSGYNVDIGITLDRNVLGVASGATGAETYFSISLLNKSYA